MKRIIAGMILSSALYSGGITLPDNFRSAFIQKITNPKKRVITYSGNVLFSTPARMKWAYTRPTKKEVCTDGRELRVVDHDLEQVSTYRISKGLDLSEIVKKAKMHKEHIYIARYLGKSYTIQTDGKGRLQSVAYYDDLDNKVQIVFKKMKYGNGTLKQSQMQCAAPKSYDEIRG